MKEYLETREYLDLLKAFPNTKITAQELVDHMRRLVPRLYSIASSPKIYPNEIHLTIAVVRYETHGLERIGVATTFLAERTLLKSSTLPVFIAKSHFKLPEDHDKDIIMVGPGTGVAPFRGFIQERQAENAKGRSWLFFGERSKQDHYLYQTDWEEFKKTGALSRLDLAFSRDQPEKIYVQDKMRAQAADLWQWINGGAYFYVCGDAKHMAKDVDATLHWICESEGGLSPEEAKAYIKGLKKEKRYQKDVY